MAGQQSNSREPPATAVPASSQLDAFSGSLPSPTGEATATAPTAAAPSTDQPQEPGNAVDQIENYLASPAGRKLAIGLKALFILVIVIVLSIQQVQFRDTWSRECDYYIKIWSTVWLGRSLLQHILVLMISCLIMANKYRSLAIGLRRFQTLIFLFKFCWFLYGIKPVLVDQRCDSTSGTWGLVLWWLEFSLTIAPCVCLCILFPIIICCFWREMPVSPDQPQPTPEDVRKKLKLVKYAEIADELEAMQAEPPRPPAPSQPEPSEDAGILSDVASTLTGVPLPDMNQLRRIQSGIMGRQQSGPQPPQRAPSGVQPSAAVVGNQLQHQASVGGAVTCPICFSSFEPKDDVIEMPCDRRHVYHKDCLFAWLEQSQQCPVCRTNVVEALQHQEEGESGAGQSKHQASTDSTNASTRKNDEDSIV